MQTEKERYFLQQTNQLLFSASKSSLLGVSAISLVIVWSLWDICSQVGLQLWLAVQICIILIRSWITIRYYQQLSLVPANYELECKHRQYFSIAVIVSAIHWVVLIVFLYPQNNPIHEAFIGVLIAGLTAGGAIGLIGSRVGFIFIAVVLIPSVIQFFLSSSELINALALLVCLFLGIVLLGVRKATQSMMMNMELRFINEERENAMKIAKEKAEVASMAKSRFLATMSHEIRTPLNSMLGMAELLSQEKLSNQQHDYAEMIVHSGNALLNIINDILDFSKIEAGKMDINPVTFNLYQDLSELIELFQTKLTQNVSISMDYANDCNLEYIGDAGRIRQVLLNLLGNAVKFTQQGKIHVQVSQLSSKAEQSRLQIVVSDTGIGMDEAFLKDLFKPFTQKDSSFSRQYAGTGLGLAICKQLVELMDGKIWAESKLNKGSQFFIQLRLKQPPQTANKPLQDSSDIATQIKTGNILLVEDVKMNRVLAKAMLKDTPLEIDEAENGRDAVSLYQKKHYPLIFMDVQMPIMDGFQATREIRQYEQENNLIASKIIALTANAFNEDREQSKTVGMDDFIAKPYKKEQLLSAVHRYLS